METRIAYETLRLIESNALEPTPPNYAFWYCYLSGENPALRHAVDRALERGTPLNETELRALRAAVPTEIDIDKVTAIAERAGVHIDQLSDLVAAVRDNAESYSAGLKTGSRGLTANVALEDKQKLIDRLVTLSSASAIRAEQLEGQIRSSQEEIEQLRQQLEKAHAESRTDPLTGLANRKAFEQHVNIQAARALADRKPLCAVFCDIDFFKKFNDTWGHAVGDEVLKLVGRSLDRFTQNVGFAARFGGEEFILILPGKSVEAACDIAEQISDFISSQKLKMKNSGEILGQITVSMGVSLLGHTDTLDDFLERADAALYHAKRTGRNRVCSELDLPSSRSEKIA